jgi:hypothetical protein
LLVLDEDRSTAVLARADLERTVGVLVVERLVMEAVRFVDLEVTIFEEDDVCRRLSGDALADGAVASVVVDRLAV